MYFDGLMKSSVTVIYSLLSVPNSKNPTGSQNFTFYTPSLPPSVYS